MHIRSLISIPILTAFALILLAGCKKKEEAPTAPAGYGTYHVFGGDSFDTTENEYWSQTGLHPEQNGYTFLGSAEGTETFEGEHIVYIITTYPPDSVRVDAVSSPSGFYFSTSTTGNVTGWQNLTGPPDGKYVSVGSGGFGGFIVIETWGLTGITVHIVE